MTIAETKQAIADAVGTVPGITAFAERPKTLRPGDAFVRWRGWTRDAGDAYMATYAVVVVTPQGSETDADNWIYERADVLADALKPVLFVDSFEPSTLPAEGRPGGMYALTITGRTE